MLPKLISNFCIILFINPVEIENEVIFGMLLREYRGVHASQTYPKFWYNIVY